jgi:hypothetical protein
MEHVNATNLAPNWEKRYIDILDKIFPYLEIIKEKKTSVSPTKLGEEARLSSCDLRNRQGAQVFVAHRMKFKNNHISSAKIGSNPYST